MNDLITSLKYLDGELGLEDKMEFEANLASNIDLLEEILLVQEIDETFSDYERVSFENNVQKIIHETKDEKPGLKTRFVDLFSNKYNMAASIILFVSFIGILILNNNKQSTNEKLYAHFYSKYDPDFIKRSDTSVDDNFSLAIEAYMDKNYENALSLLGNLELESKNLISAKFYSGLCFMELAEYDKAIHSFKEIDDPKSLICIHSRWYTALAYIKLDKKEDATALLNLIVKEGGYYKNSALQLLDDLK